MSLFFSLLPIYVFGNLHCLGMCGPLVALLGKHRFCYGYFIGRIFSFSLAGLLAAEMGLLTGAVFKELHIPAVTSLCFGTLSLWIAFSHASPSWLGKMTNRLSSLLMKETPWTPFLFGLLTILLPCGQTLFIFSALALSESPTTGLFNGFAFALLTSPSLILALQAHKLLPRNKKLADRAILVSALLVGFLAIARALSEWELIPHVAFNHFVLF